ncbi:MAG TPA: hypothetical protein VJ692_14610 [Nitrospiraceae bacterium]|nr:hypothetical protein [Nitrospiraceae bacterium]
MEDQNPYQDGKRAGAHPLVVFFGIIIGLWLLIAVFLPNPKRDRQGTVPGNPETLQQTAEEPDASPVMFRVMATVPDVNAVSIVVPEQATTSQIVGLLKRFREARLNNTLSDLIPPTTPGHKLGPHAIADVYIFSNAKFATPDAVRVLARGAHAPGDLYPQAIPFEIAMEQVRGHYRIDLNDTGNPDRASVGFADESGVHAKHYRPLFGS